MVHREIAEHPDRDILEGNYFRLNVPQGMATIGLAEWDKLKTMIALTNRYMEHGEMKEPETQDCESPAMTHNAQVSPPIISSF